MHLLSIAQSLEREIACAWIDVIQYQLTAIENGLATPIILDLTVPPTCLLLFQNTCTLSVLLCVISGFVIKIGVH